MTLGQFRHLTKEMADDVEIVIQDGEGEEVVPTSSAQPGHYNDFAITVGPDITTTAVAIWRA